jgi:hypothetical protein
MPPTTAHKMEQVKAYHIINFVTLLQGVDYLAWEWICISLDSEMVVLMVLVQKQNSMSPCLKLYGPVSQMFWY